MSTKIIFETDRLLVREFNLEDANFIIELLNTPSWLQFIGDRSVSTVKDAEGYLKNGPIKSYKENGFGLWMVAFKDSLRPIGMCGLLKRDALDDVDIGFALLPEYAGSGYGFEAAAATLRYAKNSLTISKVIAITSPENITSINLLGKLGLRFARTAYITGDKPSLVFEPEGNSNDLSEINTLTELFFEVFTSTNGRIPDVKNIHNFFVKEGMIINNTSGSPEVYNLNEFILPREKLLIDGALTDFSEREISHETKIFGNMAQRFSLYEKSGRRQGKYFESRGMKSFQFARVDGQWKISSLIWADE